MAFANIIGIIIDVLIGVNTLSFGFEAVGSTSVMMASFAPLLIIAGLFILFFSLTNQREGHFFWLWMSFGFVFIGLNGVIRFGSVLGVIISAFGAWRMHDCFKYYINQISQFNNEEEEEEKVWEVISGKDEKEEVQEENSEQDKKAGVWEVISKKDEKRNKEDTKEENDKE